MRQETTISELSDARMVDSGAAGSAVSWYLNRLSAQAELKAFVSLSDRATDDANSSKGALPLSGIPVAIKDNMEVAGLPMTCGTQALLDYVPTADCNVVERLKAAGAVLLGKTSMSEFAWGVTDTIGTAFGMTQNPYGTRHACGGSSGGSAVAVSANLACVALGTDTGCSVRAPASMTALVGLRPTLGLVSMDGIMPMSRFLDTVGPLARTALDAAKVLKIIASHRVQSDLDDHPMDWRFSVAAVESAPVTGYRIGDVRSLGSDSDIDDDVLRVYLAFLDAVKLKSVADIVPLSGVDWPKLDLRPWYRLFRHDVDTYLLKARPDHSSNTLAEIVEDGGIHPLNAKVLSDWAAIGDTPATDEFDGVRATMRGSLRDAVLSAMDRDHLDAIVFPTFRHPPPVNGVRTGPIGNNNSLAAIAGFPAVSVPMGYCANGLPLGAQIVGRPWSEERLLQIAHTLDITFKYRRVPPNAATAESGPLNPWTE